MYFYILLFSLIVILAVTAFDIVKRYKLKVAQLAAVRQFQEANKMSAGDLQIFKETMRDAKGLIIEADHSLSQLNEVPDEVTQALQASKEIFSHLMVEPKNLILYGDFLYRTLPAFTSALERAKKMNELQLNSAEYKKNKEEITRFLLDLSANILEDYGQYMNEEFEETKIAHEITQ